MSNKMGICCIKETEEPTRNADLRYSLRTYEESLITDLSLENLQLLKLIGRGKYGKVFLAKRKDTKEYLALKVIYKVSEDQKSKARSELEVLEKADHNFVVGMKHFFETERKVYLVLEYMAGGELFFHMQKSDKYGEYRAKFYTAEVILALEYLHSIGILYRDLKPENILLSLDGHIKLSDFGLSKFIGEEPTFSFCGTAEYIAPEVIIGEGYNKQVDFWSIGAVLHEMVTGRTPFFHQDKDQLFRNIVNDELLLPRRLSKHLSDLLTKLLEKNPNHRLSNFEALKAHPFFSTIKWEKLANKKVKPPFKPPKSKADDVVNFDREFTIQPAIDDDELENQGSTS